MNIKSLTYEKPEIHNSFYPFNIHYILFRSIYFQSQNVGIGTIEGSGTTSSIKNYKFIDSWNSNTETTYYQLQQFDFNGVHVTFPLIKSSCVNNGKGSISVYPNPANSHINIALDIDYDGFAKLKIFNALGQIAIQKQVEVNTGVQEIQIKTDGLAAGIYYVRLETRSTPYTFKIDIKH